MDSKTVLSSSSMFLFLLLLFVILQKKIKKKHSFFYLRRTLNPTMTFVEYSEWHLLWLKESYSCRCQTTTLLAIHYVGRLFLRVPLEFGHLEVTIGWNDLIITAESCSSLRVFQSTGSFNSASRKYIGFRFLN